MPSPNAEVVSKIRAILASNDFALESALLRIFDRQTAGEQDAGVTVEHNGMGFTGVDAEILTSFANQVRANRYGRPMGQRLTDKQRVILRRRMAKYAGQLASIAPEKHARVLAIDEARATSAARLTGVEVETEEEKTLAAGSR
jgi:hypothetical protein